MSAEVLKKLAGSWQGTCRTWFEPGKLADESPVQGEFEPVLEGKFWRHTYSGTMQGRPRLGEELLAFNGVTKQFQVAWFDSFHMICAIMFSAGEATDHGFAVTGSYDSAPGTPPWGWRTEYAWQAVGQLVITAFNISPDGQEAKAVETKYRRRADRPV